MTICIAALCEDRKSIALAADRMVSNYLAQAETSVTKMRYNHRYEAETRPDALLGRAALGS